MCGRRVGIDNKMKLPSPFTYAVYFCDADIHKIHVTEMQMNFHIYFLHGEISLFSMEFSTFHIEHKLIAFVYFHKICKTNHIKRIDRKFM